MRSGTNDCTIAPGGPTMTMKSATTAEEMYTDVSVDSTSDAATISGAATALHPRMNHSIQRWSPDVRTR